MDYCDDVKGFVCKHTGAFGIVSSHSYSFNAIKTKRLVIFGRALVLDVVLDIVLGNINSALHRR